ncbi:MAG: four helix bundle protein [Planctomycetes bacterium]|nr:four helix bundle protein [Planctomycetota bacterium]
MTASLPQSVEAQMVRSQLARSAASIGSNVEEAAGAITQPDRRRTLVVARKEARETRFWLRLLERRWGLDVGALMGEATELLNILSAIISKLS